ncbi:hypothetical protein GGI22_001596 [Coemansia erecta]|nr:hypothetical protein GGI22_001596 [Coemansia erecta]
MSANRHSNQQLNRRQPATDEGANAPRRRPHPPTPQPDDQVVDDHQFSTQELGLDRDSLEGLWQRLLASAPDEDEDIGTLARPPRMLPRANLPGIHIPRTTSTRRAQHILTSSGGTTNTAATSSRRAPQQSSLQWQPIMSRWESSPWHPRRQGGDADDDSDGSAERDHTEEWTFVNMRPWMANTSGGSASSPPRARRRLSGARRMQMTRANEDSSGAVPHGGFEFMYEERNIDDSGHSSSSEDEGPEHQRNEVSEDLLASANSLDYEQMLLRNPVGGTLWRMLMARNANGPASDQALPDSRARSVDALLNRLSTPHAPTNGAASSSAATSVVIRQPWNKTTIPWRPFVYQQPLPNSNNQVRNATERYKHHMLPGTGADKTKEYAVHSGVRSLPVSCTNADDMGRGTLDNMFATNSTLYITSRHENVHLELSLASPQANEQQHCVVERILVRSSMASPPCCELMVFASSKRCHFSEFTRYDGYTFEKYERLVSRVEKGRVALNDPIPVAYFWLSEEEEYQQMQILPHGVCCKYLYLKLLRGRSSNQRMSLRFIRVFGWNGPRAFAETTIC